MRYNSILLIDDDAEDRDIFSKALREVSSTIAFWGIGNAVEALHAIKAREIAPDVIFVDLNMPVMTGQEFLIEIKKDKELRSIPVVVFTTSSHKATIELVKELGAMQFITKPETYGGLVNVVSSFLADTIGKVSTGASNQMAH